jgi:hypothetical protein
MLFLHVSEMMLKNCYTLFRVHYCSSFQHPTLSGARFASFVTKVRAFAILLAKVNLSLCLTNQKLRHEDVWKNQFIDPHILNLGTRWVVTLTPRPLYPHRKNPRYLFDRLGGIHNRSARCGEEKFLSLLGLEPRTLCRPAHSQALYRAPHC